jgi:hypothetical protein
MTSSAGASGSNVLTVKSDEYTYQLEGRPKGGWVQINFENAGVEDHMMVVVSLKKGTTQKQFTTAMAAGDEAFLAIAGKTGDPQMPGTPALVGAGQKTTTFTKLPAGTYGLACFVRAPDGKTHAEHGMMKVFNVTGSSDLKPPSDGAAAVTLNDSSITVPPGDAPKNLTVKVTNDGTTPHDFQLIRIADGKTLDEAAAYLVARYNTGIAPEGVAAGILVGGVSAVAPSGGVAYVRWSLPAGNYGYASTTGQPPNDDYTKGLRGTFTVK